MTDCYGIVLPAAGLLAIGSIFAAEAFTIPQHMEKTMKSKWVAPMCALLAVLIVLPTVMGIINLAVKRPSLAPIVVTHPIDENATFKISSEHVIELQNDASGKFMTAIRREGNTAEATIFWRPTDKSTPGIGEVDRYVTTNGKLSYFGRTFEGNKGLKWDVSYESNGTKIAVMHRFAEDGTLLEELASTNDGGRRKRVYSGGSLVSETIIAFNGDQTIREFEKGSDVPVKTSTVKAERSTRTFGGNVTLANGKQVPVLTVELVGDRIVSWEWQRADGKVSQIGRFFVNGKMVVSYYAEGKRRLVETYTPKVEDWNRTFYRLESVEAFFVADDSKLDRGYYLRADGSMAEAKDGNINGRLNWVRTFDEKGRLIRERTITGDKPTDFKETEKDGKETGKIDSPYQGDKMTLEPTFSIAGEPFKGEPSASNRIDSFFNEPGKEIKPAPIQYYGGHE